MDLRFDSLTTRADADDCGRRQSRRVAIRANVSGPMYAMCSRVITVPRGHERERVWARDSDATLRGSQVRTLGDTFRVAPAAPSPPRRPLAFSSDEDGTATLQVMER